MIGRGEEEKGREGACINKEKKCERSEWIWRKEGWLERYFLLENREIPWNSDRDPREIKTVERWDLFRATDSISCNPYPGGMPLEYSWFLLSAYRCEESQEARISTFARVSASKVRNRAFWQRRPPAANQLPLSKFLHKDRLILERIFEKVPDERVSNT